SQIRGGITYEDVGPGGIIGEMGVIETQELRSATVYALTDSELVEINDARFAQLIAGSPSFAIAVMRTLSRRLRAMDRRDRTPLPLPLASGGGGRNILRVPPGRGLPH